MQATASKYRKPIGYAAMVTLLPCPCTHGQVLRWGRVMFQELESANLGPGLCTAFIRFSRTYVLELNKMFCLRQRSSKSHKSGLHKNQYTHSRARKTALVGVLQLRLCGYQWDANMRHAVSSQWHS